MYNETESLEWKSGNGKPNATVHTKHEFFENFLKKLPAITFMKTTVFNEKYCVMDFITYFPQEFLMIWCF